MTAEATYELGDYTNESTDVDITFTHTETGSTQTRKMMIADFISMSTGDREVAMAERAESLMRAFISRVALGMFPPSESEPGE